MTCPWQTWAECIVRRDAALERGDHAAAAREQATIDRVRPDALALERAIQSDWHGYRETYYTPEERAAWAAARRAKRGAARELGYGKRA